MSISISTLTTAPAVTAVVVNEGFTAGLIPARSTPCFYIRANSASTVALLAPYSGQQFSRVIKVEGAKRNHQMVSAHVEGKEMGDCATTGVSAMTQTSVCPFSNFARHITADHQVTAEYEAGDKKVVFVLKLEQARVAHN